MSIKKIFTRKFWKWKNLSLTMKIALVTLAIFTVASSAGGYIIFSIVSEYLLEGWVASGKATVNDFVTNNRGEFLGGEIGKRNLRQNAEALLVENTERITRFLIYDHAKNLMYSKDKEVVERIAAQLD